MHSRVRETSLTAYRTIVDNGLLSEKRLQVYRALAEHGPMTGSEVDRFLGGQQMDPAYSRRLSELRDAGVVREVRKRPCSITGNLAIEWEITDDLPRKEDRTKPVDRPSASTLQEAIVAIERLGSGAPPALVTLLPWLRDGARCPKGH